MTLFVIKILERKNQRAGNGKDKFISSITLGTEILKNIFLNTKI